LAIELVHTDVLHCSSGVSDLERASFHSTDGRWADDPLAEFLGECAELALHPLGDSFGDDGDRADRVRV